MNVCNIRSRVRMYRTTYRSFFQELQDKLEDRQLKVECLEFERNSIREELKDKILELERLREAYDRTTARSSRHDIDDAEGLRQELMLKSAELDEKNIKVDQLTKELQVKTQNLQKLVNTELWSKNKEIAKLHNHMTASSQDKKSKPEQDIASSNLDSLIRVLQDVGVAVTFADDVVRLNHANGNVQVDLTTMADYIERLDTQKNELEKEVDYLKWLKLVSKPDFECCASGTERDKKYCELLRTHLKDLVNFMKEMLKSSDQSDTDANKQKKIMLDALLGTKILSSDFIQALKEISVHDSPRKGHGDDKFSEGSVRKSKSENVLDLGKHAASTPSDSETFSEPDRTVSMARIGLQEPRQKSLNRSRFSKYSKKLSDSEDSMDYVPCHTTCQNEDLDANHFVHELKETSGVLYAGLIALRNELVAKSAFDKVSVHVEIRGRCVQ